MNSRKKEASPNPQPDARRLAVALEEYMRIVEDGAMTDRESFLSGHDDIRDELVQCIDGLDFVERLAPSLRDPLKASSQPDSEVTEHHPKSLGDYRILGEMGRGGMGVVYEAEQLSLARRVALKVLPMASFLDERQLRRFKNEARAAASLKHPNIVSVYGVGTERSVHFYAMELIEGADLARVILQVHGGEPTSSRDSADPTRNEQIDTSPIAELSTQRTSGRDDFFRSVARLGMQSAEALHFAHEEGVIHRDIKPANLLLDRDSNVHVADFGLARLAGSEDLTLTGDTMGTLRYMSPEQIIGKQLVDQRTDIYSLGVTLYELLSGRPAFAATSRHEVLRDVVETTPTDLANLVPDASRDLVTVIQCAIAKDRDARYQTMGEMAADLRRFLDHRPVLAKPPTTLQRARKWCVRNKQVVMFTSVVLVSMLVGLVAVLNQWLQTRAAKNQIAMEAYATNMLLSYESYNAGDLRNAKYHHQQATKADGRCRSEFEWQFMAARIDAAAAGSRVVRFPGRPMHVVLSHDGHAIYVAHNGGISKWDVQSDRQIWQHKLPPVERARQLAINVSGSQLYTFAGRQLFVLETEGGNAIKTVEMAGLTKRSFRDIRLNSDESRALLITQYSNKTTRDTEIYACDIESGEVDRIHATDIDETERFAVGPNGKYVATSHRDHSVWLRRADDWSLLRQVGKHRSTVRKLQFSRDGRFLVTGAHEDSHLERWETRARVWDLEHQCEFLDWPPIQPGDAIYVAPNWDAYVTSGVSGEMHLHFPRQRKSEILHGHMAPVRLATWSSDGRCLASVAEDEIRVWQIERPQVRSSVATDVMSLEILNEKTAFISAESWEHEPDSKVVLKVNLQTGATEPLFATADLPTGICLDHESGRLFCGQYNGHSQVWDLASPNKEGDALGIPGFVSETAVSHDGNYLATGEYKTSLAKDKVNIKLWNVATDQAELVGEYELPWFPMAMDFSPDDRFLAACDWQSNVRVIDISSGEYVLRKQMAENYAYDLCFSPCGKYLAASDSSRRAWLWNTKTWETVGEAMPHRGGIQCLAFSPSSKRLATSGVDRTVFLWDVETQRLLARIQLEGDSVSAIGFTPSGQKLVCVHNDRSVTVLNAVLQELRAQQ